MSSSSQSVAFAQPSRNLNLILLLVLGFIALLFAEQVATGWLALGERLGITRRDLNITEIVIIILGAVWGLFLLWTAAGMMRDSGRSSLRAYYDEGGTMPAGGWYVTAVLAVMGIVCLLIAVQIFTGWLPLGARANISRRDLNLVEWVTIALTIFWVHRMRNILCKLPEKARSGIKKLLQKAFTAQSHKTGLERAQAIVAM